MRQRPSHLGKDLRPSLFSNLSKVLREMGHEGDARRIAMFKESTLRPIRVRRAHWVYRLFVWIIGISAVGPSCGYGYRPHRLFVTLFAL